MFSWSVQDENTLHQLLLCQACQPPLLPSRLETAAATAPKEPGKMVKKIQDLSEEWERYPTTKDPNESQAKFTCSRLGPGPAFKQLG